MRSSHRGTWVVPGSCGGLCHDATASTSSTNSDLELNVMTKLPSRLHHTAYVTRDLEATRKFYEELIGLPLVATWCEKDELFGAERVYCHLFFALADGGALAFFKFAKPEDEAQFGPKMPFSPFHHI